MEMLAVSRYRTILLVVTVVLLTWGVLGALDIRHQTYTGYVTDGNNTITQVTEGSPADAAGLATGDYIRRIGGIPVEDVSAGAQRGRPKIGEVRTFEIERKGRALSFDLSYVALPTNVALVGYAGVLIGLMFLVCGVWAFVAAPSKRTLLLSVLGIAFSPGFSVGPYFTSAAVRTAVGLVILLMVIVGFAVLTHFLLVFPQPKRTLTARTMTWAVYGPAVVVASLTAWLLVAQPPATSGLNVFFRALLGLVVVGYFGASLIALIHSYVRADARHRAANGLTLLLLGAVVGLGPWFVVALVGLIAPQVVIPGARLFLPLSVVVLPLTLAIAAVRGERSAQTA